VSHYLQGLTFGLGMATASWPMGYAWARGAADAHRPLDLAVVVGVGMFALLMLGMAWSVARVNRKGQG
jgi:hypothetical protein